MRSIQRIANHVLSEQRESPLKGQKSPCSLLPTWNKTISMWPGPFHVFVWHIVLTNTGDFVTRARCFHPNCRVYRKRSKRKHIMPLSSLSDATRKDLKTIFTISQHNFTFSQFHFSCYTPISVKSRHASSSSTSSLSEIQLLGPLRCSKYGFV
jgi:hypothetical protein